MGGSSSIPADAYICKYNKESFDTKLDVIRDAHDVSQFYATLLLEEHLPIKLDEYKNYSNETEEYFNPTRKNILTDLGMSYYQFFQYINSIPTLYEKTDMNGLHRRKMITEVFNKCYIVQKYIIEDLWEDCNSQNGFRIPSRHQKQQSVEFETESTTA